MTLGEFVISDWLLELSVDDKPSVFDHLELTWNDLIGLMRRRLKKGMKIRQEERSISVPSIQLCKSGHKLRSSITE